MPKSKSIHAGHRERLKKRFLNEGLDNFEEINALELLLFYCIPQQDTNPLAHRLLDEFGCLRNVLEADIDELKKVPGMGDHSALYLSLIRQTCRYYAVCTVKPRRKLETIEECAAYIRQRFIGRTIETVYMLALDAQSRAISCRKVGEGSVGSANVPFSRVVDMALHERASSVVLAHNHPGGSMFPSKADITTTSMLRKSLDAVQIKMVDHLIITDDGCTSISQNCRLNDCNIF